ncbi:MAG: SpoIIE family protein phosphatase [Syntrophales bacterium]|nr:SpoIIE family protein phosphatase [Syntrophales bacterium]
MDINQTLTDQKARPRFRIRTKILLVFLGLSIIPLLLFGYVAFRDIREVSNYVLQSSTTVGNSAANDSAKALEALGAEILRQRATDVALQCKIFIDAHPGLSTQDLQSSREFQKIAVQPVGETGYTIVYEKRTGIMRFHINPRLINFDMHNWREKLPEFWALFERSLDGTPVGGYYDWQDTDRKIRKKFMYMAPVEGTRFMVSATTYIDEFSRPANLTKKQIDESTRTINEQMNESITGIRNTFVALLVAMIFVVACISYFLSQMITDPIIALIRGVKALGRGDMEYQVEVNTGDELESLAKSFNKMITDLKVHVEELQCTTAEKEGLLKELEIARSIQQRLLPQTAPKIEGFDLAAHNEPAREVGGDFYDFIPVMEDNLGLVIADVSGKGMPAAMFMGLSRTIIRASTTGDPAATNAIKQANELICRDSTSGMFVTLFYGVLNTRWRRLRYVNAGHNPPMVFRKDSSEAIFLKAKGIALGVATEIDLEESSIDLMSGDILVMYTDGITEAINEREEVFGLERLIRVILTHRDMPSQAIIDQIQREVSSFAGDQPQFDDITLMILKLT